MVTASGQCSCHTMVSPIIVCSNTPSPSPRLWTDISSQLNRIQEWQNVESQRKHLEMESLRQEVAEQRSLLASREDDIRRLHQECRRQQQERANELRSLVLQSRSSSISSNNPYQQSNDESGTDTCMEHAYYYCWLLYTSDAADDSLCVDSRCHRIQ